MSKNQTGRMIDGVLQQPKRQLAMVFDLNKCLGCHTCSVACKTQWTGEEGMENMWWTVVNTHAGQGNATRLGAPWAAASTRTGNARPGTDSRHARSSARLGSSITTKVFQGGKGKGRPPASSPRETR